MILVAIIILLGCIVHLYSRVRRLEELMEGHVPAPVARPAASEIDTPSSTEVRLDVLPPGAVSSDTVYTLDASDTASSRSLGTADTAGLVWFERALLWLREDWLLKLGALLFLIGFGWLVSYAFVHNWIGPVGRITLGILTGVSGLVFGWIRIRRYQSQGSVFLVLGSTLVLLTLFAARSVYDFFTPGSALLVMFLSVCFVALASVQYRTKSLAVLSLVLAGIAPLLTHAPEPDTMALFLYLLVVMLGSVWVVALRGWQELGLLSLLLVVLYSVPEWFSASPDTDVLLVAYACTVVLFVASILGLLRQCGNVARIDMLTATGTGGFLILWVMIAAPKEWVSVILVAWLLIFLGGGLVLFRLTKAREPLWVYAGVSVLLLAAATAAEFMGALLTMAYTIEAGALLLLSHRLTKARRVAERMSVLLVVPMLLSIGSIDADVWHPSEGGVLHEHFFALLTLTVVLLTLGAYFVRYAKRLKHEITIRLDVVLLMLGTLYAGLLLWLTVHDVLQNETDATFFALLIYTLAGLVAYFGGHFRGIALVGRAGACILIGVVARLLLIDVWDMALAGRIVTFLSIGALFIATAFIHKHKQRGW